MPPGGPQVAILPDGRRLHLQHGPIDLIIDAQGPTKAVRTAWQAAELRFRDVLATLVAELPTLRSPCPPDGPSVTGPVAQRMARAVTPHAQQFVTPMAAVAGAVADEMRDAILQATTDLTRLSVNNGGDIALWLAPDEQLTTGVMHPGAATGTDTTLRLIDRLVIGASDGVGGIASSSRHGRSFSLGIADNVTVLARTAAMADVAATLIANAVDLTGHPSVKRQPAREMAPDSDLGTRPVTTAVATLIPADVETALAGGAALADRMLAKGLIDAALLTLQDTTRQVGPLKRPGGADGLHPEPLVRGGLRVGVR